MIMATAVEISEYLSDRAEDLYNDCEERPGAPFPRRRLFGNGPPPLRGLAVVELAGMAHIRSTYQAVTGDWVGD
jgi:hypothetical protein